MNQRILGVLIIFLSVLFFQCKNEKVPQENIKVAVPRFDGQNAYDHVQKQVDFGPRLVGTPGHEACKNWLVETLSSYGFVVRKLNFDAQIYTGEKVTGTNIIASYNPQVIERVLLAGHWDTRHIAEKDSTRKDEPILGADDGASGPAVLLEIARLIQENPIPMGLDIVLFDLEDHGDSEGESGLSWGLGSQHWSKSANKSGYSAKYAVVLSMVGAKDARFTVEGITAASAPVLANKIWNLGKAMGKDKIFIKERTDAIVDDHRFIFQNLGIPVIYLSNRPKDSMFGHYHHTHGDNMDIISKQTLSAVGQVLTAVIYQTSNKELETS